MAQIKYHEQSEIDKLIIKISPIIRQNGVSALKIDDFTKYMDISKSTFYKYFDSKDDVIEKYVMLYIRDFIQLNETIFTETDTLDSNKYLLIFQKLLMQAIYGSVNFLSDIKNSYPNLWELIQLEIMKRSEQLEEIYQIAITNGILREVDSRLLTFQDEIFFEKITQPAFLVSRSISIEFAVRNYFEMRLKQLFVRSEDFLPLNQEIIDTLTFSSKRLSISTLL